MPAFIQSSDTAQDELLGKLVFRDEGARPDQPGLFGLDAFDDFVEEAARQGWLVSHLWEETDRQIAVLPVGQSELLAVNSPEVLASLLELAEEHVPVIADELSLLWAKTDQLGSADVVRWQQRPEGAVEGEWIRLVS